MGFLSKLLTMGEGKQLKRYQAKVDKINALEPEFQALPCAPSGFATSTCSSSAAWP